MFLEQQKRKTSLTEIPSTFLPSFLPPLPLLLTSLLPPSVAIHAALFSSRALYVSGTMHDSSPTSSLMLDPSLGLAYQLDISLAASGPSGLADLAN